MQCPQNSTYNLATSTVVKLFMLFKLNLLPAAILSKIHTVHPTQTLHCTKCDAVEPYLNFEHYNFDLYIVR